MSLLWFYLLCFLGGVVLGSASVMLGFWISGR